MDILTAHRMARDLLRQHNLDHLHLEWNRSTRLIGSCIWRDHKPHTIKLSSHFVLHMTPDEVKDTVLHEIAHALDVLSRGKSNHDHHWKAICLAVGAKPERTSHIKVPYRYEVKCSACGHVFRGRNRWDAKIKQSLLFSYHRKCGKGAGLTVTDTRTGEKLL